MQTKTCGNSNSAKVTKVVTRSLEPDNQREPGLPGRNARRVALLSTGSIMPAAVS